MPPKVMLFVGAPEYMSLNWEENDLLKSFTDPFIRFARIETTQEAAIPVTTNSSASIISHPVWRSLPLQRQYLNTGVSQDHGWRPEFQGASFFTTSDIDSYIEGISQQQSDGSFTSSSESVEQVLSQYYEESYARHDDISSSQLVATSGAETSFTSDDRSFDTTGESELHESQSPKEVPKSGPLSHVKDIPNAWYIIEAQPQVVTVNLIVGIISIPPPRLIRTKKGADVDLVEALVGDETKSGFGVSFWLPSSQAADGGLRAAVEALRPQDIVLMRNVALSTFRGRVYGQSLRKGFTKVHLLYRNRIDRKDERGCYTAADLAFDKMADPQTVKARTVREWVLKFVGRAGSSQQGKRRASKRPESLPPDTQ